MKSKQPEEGDMPLVKAIKNYTQNVDVLYHMPGHKRGAGFPQWLSALLISGDITEVTGLDNLANAESVIKQAQIELAKAYGTKQSFFITQGSTVGNQAMVMAICRRGDSLILPRNVHASVIHACILKGIRPIWIMPTLNKKTNRMNVITLENIQKAVKENPEAVGALIVSPTYYGETANISEIAYFLHKQNKLCVVDAAHGAHFQYSTHLPQGLAEQGADCWVHSAHKTLPVLTQGAYLHVSNERLVDKVNSMLRVLHTTSPSYAIMASLDYARATMVTMGDQLYNALYEKIELFKDKLHKTTCIKLEQYGKNRDFSRLVLDVKATGLSGWEWARYARETYKIECEMEDYRYVVCIATPFDPDYFLERLLLACQETNGGCCNQYVGFEALVEKSLAVNGKVRCDLSEVEEMVHEKVLLTNATGRIAAESIGLYPPGTPIVCAGEEITQTVIELINEAMALGANVLGINNGEVMVLQ